MRKALFCSAPVQAQMTNCNRIGNSVSCYTTPSSSDTEYRRNSRQQRQSQTALEEGLRKSDWPGAPDRAEYQQMYGN